MSGNSEVKSENARNVILSYDEKVYFVNKVNVQISDESEKLKAVFHARKLHCDELEDLDIEINKQVYEILIEYAKLDKLDLILILQIQGDDAKWCLMSENWLKNLVPPAVGNPFYIV